MSHRTNEELPVTQQTFAASIRGETHETLAQKVASVERMSVTIRRQILTTLSLYRALPRNDLVHITKSHPGCEWQDMRFLPEAVIDSLIFEGRISQSADGILTHVERPEEIPQGFLDKADAYKNAREKKQTLGARLAQFAARFLHKFWGGVFLISAVSITLALCVLLTPTASGVEGWTTAEATAYCPCALCCGTTDGITANNTSTNRVPYNFAADRSLPFGTRVFVPLGLGVLDRVRADDRWFSVDDRGGALDAEARKYGTLRLDLRVRDHWWAVKFGRRSLPVFITKN